MADEKAEKNKAIELALAQIEKQFGKGSIMRLGSKEAIVPIAVISTGSISFDAALGVGGFPRGRVVEVFGPESSGKTTVALQVIAEAQKQGGMAAFVDAEHALRSEEHTSELQSPCNLVCRLLLEKKKIKKNKIFKANKYNQNYSALEYNVNHGDCVIILIVHYAYHNYSTAKCDSKVINASLTRSV